MRFCMGAIAWLRETFRGRCRSGCRADREAGPPARGRMGVFRRLRRVLRRHSAGVGPLTRVAAAALVIVFAVKFASGFFAFRNGFEFERLLGLLCLAILFIGGGKL